MMIVRRGGLAVLALATCAQALRTQQPSVPAAVVSGQVRFRGEWDGRTAAAGDDAAVLSRVRVGVSTAIQPWLNAFVQLQDARAWGTETDPTEGTADQFDLHQGYLDLARGRATLRLGRQEMGLGDERLVGSLLWANTARSFDGVLVRRELPRGHVRVFWMNVMERDALSAVGVHPQLNEGSDADGWLLGGFITRDAGFGTVEALLLHDRKAATDESWTAHGRLHSAAGPLLYDASAAYQFGPHRRAYLFSGTLGVPVGEGAGRGRVAVQLDYLSGDDDPADAERRAFSSLYPTAHAYHGFMDYFVAFPGNTAAAGLLDAILRLQVPSRGPWNIRGDVHYFALAEDRQGQRALGVEADLVAARRMAPGAALEAGASVFAPRDAMGTVARAFAADARATTYWGYVMLTVAW